MKTVITILTLVLILGACKKDDDANVDSETLKADIQEGTWKVSYFEDDGTDETYHFEGFSFTFNADGSVVATNGSETYNGTWSLDDESNDDSPDDDDDFELNFNVSDQNEFDELNDDWDILSQSSTKIELQDVSGGDGSVDKVTFTKE